MQKKIQFALIGLLLAAIFVAGCGNNEGNKGSDKGKVTKIEFFQQQGEEAIQNAYRAIIEDFTKEYPNIKIEMNTVPDSVKVLTARIASNDIPPLFTDWPTQLQFKEKVKNGYIEKLSGKPFLDKVNKDYLAMTPATDGEYYSLPYARNYMAVYYNVDLFAKHGVAVPTTYAEFIEVCKTLEAASVTPLYLGLKDVGHVFQATNIAYVPGGVEELAKAVKGEGKIEGNAAFLEYGNKLNELVKYANKDAYGASTAMMQEAFANGNVAMIISGSYGRGNIKMVNPDLKFGAFPLPNETLETTTALSGVNAALSVSAKATPEEKEAALTFIEYISRTEVAQKWSDLSGEPSIIQGTVYEDEYLKPLLTFIDKGQVHDWMASTLPGPVVTELYSTTQAFLMEKQSVKDYLKNIDQTIKLNAVK